MEGRISHRGACAANSRRFPPPLLLFANLSHTLNMKRAPASVGASHGKGHNHGRGGVALLWATRARGAGVNSVDRMERDGQPLTCTGASLQCRGW